jgi:hypothetical protein
MVADRSIFIGCGLKITCNVSVFPVITDLHHSEANHGNRCEQQDGRDQKNIHEQRGG